MPRGQQRGERECQLLASTLSPWLVAPVEHVGSTAALPQPGGGDHRRRVRGGDDAQQRVESLHPGVAAPGAVLGVAVGLAQGVIDVDVGQLVGTDQQRRQRGQADQQPGGDRAELADVAEGEAAQERAQRGRCPVRQFAVQDPDGYLLRLTQNIGTRPRRQ